MQPHDNDNEHNANEDHDGPLEPWFAVLWAETYLSQIAHEIAVSRELFTNSGAERMIAERSVCDEDGKNGAERKVCSRKVAIETNTFCYTLDNTGKTDSARHGGCEEVCGGYTTEKTEAVDGPRVQRPFPFTLRVPF
jgi:hypothetical protein